MYLKKNIISKIFEEKSYKIIFLLFLSFLIFPFDIFATPESGIDGSWAIAINLAIKNKLIWGKDFVFSYGPLGYLATRIREFIPSIHIILFHLYVWVNLSLIAFKIIKNLKCFNGKYFVYSLLYLACVYNFIKPELSSFLLLSFTFWIIEATINKNIYSAVNACVLGVLMFFIKIDSGIITILFLALFYLYQFIFKKSQLKYFILLILNISVIFILSNYLRVNLGDYLISSIHVIGSYNDAMYIQNNILNIVIGLLITVIFILITAQNINKIVSKNDYILSYFYCIVTLFILFKHGFVRHGGYGFLYPPLTLIIAIYILYFLNPKYKGLFMPLFILQIMTSITIFTIHSVENIDINSPKLFNAKIKTLNYISNKLYQKNYVIPIRKRTGIDSANIPIILPEKIKIQISKLSVDVVPHLISTIYYNNLNYSPRPGIQSYANYDSFLDNMGYKKYSSPEKPNYIIYCGDNINYEAAIDNRYPFFDEPKTKLAMLENYSVIDSFQNQLLLKKCLKKNILSAIKLKSIVVKLNTPIEIMKTNSILVMSFDIKYNFLGRIIRFIYQPPSIKINFKLEDGREYTFKIIKDLLKEGVIINKLLLTNKDVKLLFNRDIKSIPQIKEIKFIGDEWGLNNKIEATIKTLEFN